MIVHLLCFYHSSYFLMSLVSHQPDSSLRAGVCLSLDLQVQWSTRRGEFAVLTRWLTEYMVSRDTLKFLLSTWSKIHMLIRAEPPSFYALLPRNFRGEKNLATENQTKTQLLCVLTKGNPLIPTQFWILHHRVSSEWNYLKHWEKMRTPMSMIVMADVTIILFDLLKSGNTSLQEAGHLCMVRTADVYCCYQVRITRGNALQNQILIIMRKRNRDTKQNFQVGSYLTRSILSNK